MKAKDVIIGTKWFSNPDNTAHLYGYYFYHEVTAIKVTKAGRIKVFVKRSYRSPEGKETTQFNVPFTNGAVAPETVIIPK